ncbi:MAG: acetyltransferase [Balneolaceae bacterium]
MNRSSKNLSQEQVAEKVREACIQAAKEGFRDASISGLCSDGAMEAAVSAIQRIDLKKIFRKKRYPERQ